MPNTVVAGNSAVLTNQGVAGDQAILNIWGLLFLDHPDDVAYPTDGSVVNAIVSIFRAAWRAAICPELSAEYVCQRYRVFTLQEPPLAPVVGWQPKAVALLGGGTPADTGGNAAEADDTFSCVSVQFGTPTPGRRGRGGKRFSPIPQSHTVFNTLDPIIKANWEAALLNFITVQMELALVGAGINAVMSVLSPTDYINAPAGPYSSDITSIIVNDYVGSQVSRKSYLRGA
jgi:hypothetical protein